MKPGSRGPEQDDLLRPRLTDTRLKRAFLDRGYRGPGVTTTAVYIAGSRRGTTPLLLRRRSGIEPAIGYMKTAGRLASCAVKRALGDALHTVLCGCGRNIRMILAQFRAFVAAMSAALYGRLGLKLGLRPLAA